MPLIPWPFPNHHKNYNGVDSYFGVILSNNKACVMAVHVIEI